MKKILILLFILFGCSQSSEDEIYNAIESANNYLSEGKCDEAKKSLDSIGYQIKNARFIQTYSSMYACKAGYSETNFFVNDISKINGASLLKSLTLFTTSSSISSNEDSYIYLQKSIDTILGAGGIDNISHQERSRVFETDELSNMEFHLLFMIFAQIGKYVSIHGNVDSLGVKGEGTKTNICFTDYTGPTALALFTALNIPGANPGDPPISANSCNQNFKGSVELKPGLITRRKNLCHGVMLFNNLLDVIANLSLAGTSLSTATGSITSVFSAICSAGLGAICSTKTQSTCEEDTSITIDQLESFIILFYEEQLKGAP